MPRGPTLPIEVAGACCDADDVEDDVAGCHRGDLVDVTRRRDLDDVHADELALADQAFDQLRASCNAGTFGFEETEGDGSAEPSG